MGSLSEAAIKARLREIAKIQAENEGLDDPNEFDPPRKFEHAGQSFIVDEGTVHKPLTLQTLEEVIKDMEDKAKSKPDPHKFEIFTGRRGMKEFDKGMEDILKSADIERQYRAYEQEYDISEADRFKALNTLNEEHYKLTGQNISSGIYIGDGSEKHYMSTKGIKVPSKMSPADWIKHYETLGIAFTDKTEYDHGDASN